MIWRVGTGFLVSDGGYTVIDATGAVTETYGDSDWAVEEDLGKTTFLVHDGQLIEHVVIEHWGYNGDDTVTDTVILDGLVEDPSEEAARFVATVFGDHNVRIEERRIRDQREAEARVDAIEGAHERLDDPEDERARSKLVERVYRWADERATELLRTLIDLVRDQTYREALDAYVRGCLLACYEPAPALVEGAPSDSSFAARVTELADRVKRDADYQSEIDANANARELWAAAEALRACARMLGG